MFKYHFSVSLKDICHISMLVIALLLGVSMIKITLPLEVGTTIEVFIIIFP